MQNATVFWNGACLGWHSSGFTGHRYFFNASELRFGAGNVLAVFHSSSRVVVQRRRYVVTTPCAFLYPWGLSVPSAPTGATTWVGSAPFADALLHPSVEAASFCGGAPAPFSVALQALDGGGAVVATSGGGGTVAGDGSVPMWAPVGVNVSNGQGIMTRDFIAGGMTWTGHDYRGEETPLGWLTVSSHFGAHDSAGFPKDRFFYNRAGWWRAAAAGTRRAGACPTRRTSRLRFRRRAAAPPRCGSRASPTVTLHATQQQKPHARRVPRACAGDASGRRAPGISGASLPVSVSLPPPGISAKWCPSWPTL